MAKMKNKAAPGTVRRVLRYIRRYRLLLLLSLLLGAVSVALTSMSRFWSGARWI